jgi:hypothetical protein
MRGRRFLVSVLLLGLMLGAVVGLSMAQSVGSEIGAAPQALVGAAFTYQGRLDNGGSPYTGQCDFRFSLHDALSGGNQVGNTQTIAGVDVDAGLFTVALNSGGQFGDSAFNGQARWLKIQVRCTGDGSYTPLAPRQELTPAPYALALPGLWTQPNTTSPNLIGGYIGNEITAGVVGANISGGGVVDYPNRVTADYATIGGGAANVVTATLVTVAGGAFNRASGDYATVGGGSGNVASGRHVTIGGGDSNKASGLTATVGGGSGNAASGHTATVGGGYSNEASGDYATIPGGSDNKAGGEYSFAAGRRANAYHRGSFVLADSTNAGFTSVREDALRARFNGGATFLVNDDFWVRFYSYAGRLIDTSTDAHLTTGGVWTNASDREAKENFGPVDGPAVLARLATVPIQTWNYKAEDPAVRRMGPTAQDFYAAFGLGEDERHISTLDADGVALAAIQGLYEQVQEQAAHIQALEAENATMQQVLEDLSVRLAALEAAQIAGEAGP